MALKVKIWRNFVICMFYVNALYKPQFQALITLIFSALIVSKSLHHLNVVAVGEFRENLFTTLYPDKICRKQPTHF